VALRKSTIATIEIKKLSELIVDNHYNKRSQIKTKEEIKDQNKIRKD